VWPDFGPKGLGTYDYWEVSSYIPISIPSTPLTVLGFPVYHSYPYLSTTFLICDEEENCVLYFGDLGPDSIENKKVLSQNGNNTDLARQVWTKVAPKVLEKRLHAIFMESSYADGVADDKLFGHLTPKWLMEELRALSEEILKLDPTATGALQNINVVVTHVKPVARENIREKVKEQLAAQNIFGINFIFPEQGNAFLVGSHTYSPYPTSPSLSWWVITLIAFVSLLFLTTLVFAYLLYRRQNKQQVVDYYDE